MYDERDGLLPFFLSGRSASAFFLSHEASQEYMRVSHVSQRSNRAREEQERPSFFMADAPEKRKKVCLCNRSCVVRRFCTKVNERNNVKRALLRERREDFEIPHKLK
jgi:hypothetical protein